MSTDATGLACRECSTVTWMTRVGVDRVDITNATGWYYSDDTGWLCPEHAPGELPLGGER